MQPKPLDYARPGREPKPLLRRISARIVIGAWIVFAAAFAFGVANSSDRSPLQFPAAIFAGLALIAAVGLTVLHWLVLVPALWYGSRRTRRGDEDL